MRVLEHPEFAAGRATTDFLGKHAFAAPAVAESQWRAAASLLWRRSAERHPPELRGWRNSNEEPTPFRLCCAGVDKLVAISRADALNAVEVPHHIEGDDVFLDSDGNALRITDRTYAPPAAAAPGGDGKLRAPMDGRVVAINVRSGDSVTRGQTLVVLEAMKIQHQLKAALDARIESVSVKEGEQVSNRAVLVTMSSQ
jgi:geranyl-CoA carboxylase alpha subunit